MKILVLLIPLVILVVFALILSRNGTSVEVFPAEAAEGQAVASLEAGGTDPADWKLEAVCLNMGACSVSVTAAAEPGTVLATNRYVVKDSKPSLNGPDRIETAAGQAVSGDCFGPAVSRGQVAACVSGAP